MSFSYDSGTDAILVNDAELKFTTAAKGVTFQDGSSLTTAIGLTSVTGLDDVVSLQSESNTTANALQLFQGFVVGNTTRQNVVVNCFSANVIDVPTGNIYSNLHTTFISFDGSNPVDGTGGGLALQGVTERGASTDQELTLTAAPVSVTASGNLTTGGNLVASSNLVVTQTAKVSGNMGLGQDPTINDKLGVTGDTRVTDGVVRVTKSVQPLVSLEAKDDPSHTWNLLTDTASAESPLKFYSNSASADRFTLWPTGRLDLNLNPTTAGQISLRDTGAVSIGTTDNHANLYLRGDLKVFDAGQDTWAIFDPEQISTGVKIQATDEQGPIKKHVHINPDGGLVSVGSATTSDTNLHVTGNVYTTGNINMGTGTSVGIGTTAQSSVLSVVGTNPYNPEPLEAGIHIGQAGTNFNSFSCIEIVGPENRGLIDFSRPGATGEGGQQLYRLISNRVDGDNNFEMIASNDKIALSIDEGGNVAIGGRTSPISANLQVSGNVHVTGDVEVGGGGTYFLPSFDVGYSTYSYTFTPCIFSKQITPSAYQYNGVGFAGGGDRGPAHITRVGSMIYVMGYHVIANVTGTGGNIDIFYNLSDLHINTAAADGGTVVTPQIQIVHDASAIGCSVPALTYGETSFKIRFVSNASGGYVYQTFRLTLAIMDFWY